MIQVSISNRIAVLVVSLLAALPVLPADAGVIRAWGRDRYGIVSNVPSGDDFIAVAGGTRFATALRADGSVMSWGYEGDEVSDAPTGRDFVAIDSAGGYCMGLRADGSIAAWGLTERDEVVDAPTDGEFIGIGAGTNVATALTADGTVVAWGDNSWGGTEGSGDRTFQAVDGGTYYSIGLGVSGSITVWGHVPQPDPEYDIRFRPSGDFSEISAGAGHALARRADGMIVGWGINTSGRAESIDGTDILTFSAGGDHNLALRTDGSLYAWGYNGWGQCDIPLGNNFTAISAGSSYSLAIQVPEPSTWAALLTAIPVGLFLLWRRRPPGARD